MPYLANLPGGLYPGRMIFISGIPFANPSRCVVCVLWCMCVCLCAACVCVVHLCVCVSVVCINPLCIVIDTTDCYIPALLLINVSENKFRIIGFLQIAFVGIYMDFSWKQLKVISLQNLYICLYNVCGFMLCESVYIFTLKRYRGIRLKHWILFNIIKNLYLSLK